MEFVLSLRLYRLRKRLSATLDRVRKFLATVRPPAQEVRMQRMCPFCGLITPRAKRVCQECGKSLSPVSQEGSEAKQR